MELKQLFQGYIINEVDMNSDSTCRENCAYYGYAKVHGCYGNQFCAQQRTCGGKLVNCEYIDSDMWICPSVCTFVIFLQTIYRIHTISFFSVIK